MPRNFSRSRSRSHDRTATDERRSDHRRSDRDRSRERRKSRDRSRNRSRDRSDDRRDNDLNKCRIHVADLTESVTQHDVEKTFGRFGEISEVWMAKNPPCFAFVVFKDKEDASDAVREMDQKVIGYNKCRVTFARPRTRGVRRRWDPEMRCFQCGERGHFSRDCNDYHRRRSDRSRSRGRGHRSSRRSRSRSRSYSRRHS